MSILYNSLSYMCRHFGKIGALGGWGGCKGLLWIARLGYIFWDTSQSATDELISWSTYVSTVMRLRSQGFINASRIQPLGAMNVFTKCYGIRWFYWVHCSLYQSGGPTVWDCDWLTVMAAVRTVYSCGWTIKFTGDNQDRDKCKHTITFLM